MRVMGELGGLGVLGVLGVLGELGVLGVLGVLGGLGELATSSLKCSFMALCRKANSSWLFFYWLICMVFAAWAYFLKKKALLLLDFGYICILCLTILMLTKSMSYAECFLTAVGTL